MTRFAILGGGIGFAILGGWIGFAIAAGAHAP